MKVKELSRSDLSRRLKVELDIATTPFITRIASPLGPLRNAVAEMYGDYQLVEHAVPDFLVRVNGTGGWRRWARRQCIAHIDMPTPFVALPEHMAPLMLEQSLNWSVAMRTATHLLFHAAIVGKGDKAIILPGESGQGKSTLCAILMTSGWRLFSDELALIDLETGLAQPYPRPVSLKNASIEVMKSFAPGWRMTAIHHGTPKGDVAYMLPRAEDLERAGELARPAAILVPDYHPDAEKALEPMAPSVTFLQMSACSINYNGFHEAGFRRLSDLVDKVPAAIARYSTAEDGVALAEQMLEGA